MHGASVEHERRMVGLKGGAGPHTSLDTLAKYLARGEERGEALHHVGLQGVHHVPVEHIAARGHHDALGSVHTDVGVEVLTGGAVSTRHLAAFHDKLDELGIAAMLTAFGGVELVDEVLEDDGLVCPLHLGAQRGVASGPIVVARTLGHVVLILNS